MFLEDQITELTLQVYRKCKIDSFPFDCISILEEYGYSCVPYQHLNPEKRSTCKQISHDAFMLNRMIFYNDRMIDERKRFSLMHELGHILLKHDTSSQNREAEANALASNILAPRMAIHYARCRNAAEVAGRFHVSREASFYMYDDYQRWYRHVSRYGMSPLDKELYQHFYDEKYKCFVWTRNRCRICGAVCVNENHYCGECRRDAV